MTEHNDSGIGQIQLLDGSQDSYGGVTVEMKEHMDADVFAPLLRASISSWKQQVPHLYFVGLVLFFSVCNNINLFFCISSYWVYFGCRGSRECGSNCPLNIRILLTLL